MLSRNAVVSGGSEALKTIHQRRESGMRFTAKRKCREEYREECREGVP